MKKIIYTRPDGGLSVVHPVEGWRLASSVKIGDGPTITANPPRSVDLITRGWPMPGAVAEWAETEDAFIARVVAKSVPADATNVQVVDESAIPADRTFRGAWKAGQGCIEHDMAKCREIHKDRMRSVRAPKLAALDVAYQRADEAGNTTAKLTIASQKQVLRDVTADAGIAAAVTPEQLKAVWPECLQ